MSCHSTITSWESGVKAKSTSNAGSGRAATSGANPTRYQGKSTGVQITQASSAPVARASQSRAKTTAAAIRDHLMPRAGLATPNRFELEWLAGARSAGNGELLRMAGALGVPRMLVTSAHAMMDKAQANLLVSARRAVLAEHRHVEGAPNGPGDLTAALMTGRLLSGQDEESALQAVTSSVFEVLARSVKAGADELRLETEVHSLIRPMAMVTMRQLARPAPKRVKP